MSEARRLPTRVALTAWAASLVVAAGALVMLVVNAATWRQAGWDAFARDALAPVVAALTYGSFGVLLVARQPRNRIGWLLLWFGIIFGLTVLASEITMNSVGSGPRSGSHPPPGATAVAWLQNWCFNLVFPTGFGVLLLLFPDGRPPSWRWRPLLWLAVGTAAGLILGAVLARGPLHLQFGPGGGGAQAHLLPIDNPTGVIPGSVADWFGRVLWPVGLLVVVAGAASLVARYRHAIAVEREQLKWLAYVGAAQGLGLLGTLAQGGGGGGLLGAIGSITFDLFVAMAVVGVPAAVAISVLRYRLYDIDVVINRTLVYGILTAFIGSGYVLIVVGIGHLAGGNGRPVLPLSIAATAIVAIAFQPARERVQRRVNRLVYGRRATPYEVLASFSHRMAATLSVEEVVPRLAEAAARSIGGSKARVRLILSTGDRIASWPPGIEIERAGHRVTVIDHGEELGEVEVVKAGGEQLSAAEIALINVLAAQAGPVFRNVRLTLELQARLARISEQAAELRASRQRIVAAADSQRRRLEREIRDGTEPQLLSIAAALGRVAGLLDTDPTSAVPLLDELNARTSQSLNQLREMARGIFPPLLADRGPVVALEAHARKLPFPVSITAPEHLRTTRFSPEVEATIYFCCVEGMRGARADLSVALELREDAVGFRIDGYGPDAWLGDMADRVAAVGGILRVDAQTLAADIPARALEPAS
ncbi:MAG: hypothetical protein NVSMB29_11330 [Candidatus Dormibacteria bacterium]